MSHSYSFRHGKSQSTSSSSTSSSSGGHQRVSYGSRSTSTGTPPQTPTIRVTSPVPDAVGVIDIWDPEVTDDEPPQTSPKTYSFRYTEEKQHKKHKRRHSDKKKKNFADSGMQADPTEAVPVQQQQQQQKPKQKQQQQQVEQEPPSVTTTPMEPVVAPQPKISLLDGSPIDDDGLKTAGESAEESSDCEEVSQISAVTQVPRCESERSPEVEEVMEEEPTGAEAEEKDVAPIDPPMEDVDDTGVVESTTVSDAQRRWDEMHPLDGKPIKRVQFSRSLSLVPGSSAAQSATGEILADGTRGVRSGAGRRYSSMDSGACSGPPLDLFPTTFAFGEQQSSFLASGGKMLSPTPESALENAQSPQQDGDDEGPLTVGDEAPQQPPPQQQQSCCNTMTELSGTVT